ncbi:MAG: FAD:protein FMN transferase, partial [Pirellulaceae bacterium]|nr:FAD:protein FMN transferase [Pirellulaceae bacterium]
MSSQHKSTRRQFLQGRAAVNALQALVDAGDPSASVPAPASAAAKSPAAPSYLLQISRRAMATDFEIYLNAGQQGRATEAALRALDLVEQLEGQMTVYRPHSEVMDVNRRAADG